MGRKPVPEKAIEIRVFIEPAYIKRMDELISKGLYTSRSALLRELVHRYLGEMRGVG